MSEEKKTEEYNVSGDDLLAKIKAIIKAGNVRRIIVKDKEGKELIVIPLTAGVVLTVLAPVLAAVGSVAALVTECTVIVERYSESESESNSDD
jgi:hypothetical protein